jgi:hypothetical protein
MQVAIDPQEIETTFGQNFELVSCLLMTYSYVILLCYWIDRHSRWNDESIEQAVWIATLRYLSGK